MRRYIGMTGYYIYKIRTQAAEILHALGVRGDDLTKLMVSDRIIHLRKPQTHALFPGMQNEPDTNAGQTATVSIARVCTVAAVALAVAMGIGRFAFTPLLPLMVRDGSLTVGSGAWLAASNYLGYLAGALTAARLSLSPPALMRASLAGIVVTTAAMGMLGGMGAWMVLRCAAGVFSAWTMVAVSAWALPHLARASRPELSGIIYASVGLGIAFTGLFCLVAAQPGVSTDRLWLGLGLLSALAVGVSSFFVGRQPGSPRQSRPTTVDASRPDSTILIICYAAFGFGYILPATFLPALARDVWDNPQVFGLAWPIFGTAAAVSTIAVAYWSAGTNRLRVWAASHLVMAIGVVLPSLWLTPASIVIAALAVGGTFIVVTMLGLQEARAQAPGNPTALLAAMTAAFAFGQLAGPLVSGALDLLNVGHHVALGYALQIAALVLSASAACLWWQAGKRR
jgi:MFS family permease